MLEKRTYSIVHKIMLTPYEINVRDNSVNNKILSINQQKLKIKMCEENNKISKLRKMIYRLRIGKILLLLLLDATSAATFLLLYQPPLLLQNYYYYYILVNKHTNATTATSTSITSKTTKTITTVAVSITKANAEDSSE